MPLAPELPPDLMEAKIKLSAAQSYANYLKYKQELEEPDDPRPCYFWASLFVGGVSTAIVIIYLVVFLLKLFEVIP